MRGFAEFREEASGGEIRIGGRLVNDLLPKDRDIAMVFQSYALYPHMDVAKNMGDVKVRRMPVVNRDKRLVGIISLGDVACNEDLETAGDAVAQVSQPGGPHSH